MAKRRVDIRVELELAAWADGYAELRGVTRTRVYEAALRRFQRETETGVPDLEQASVPHSSPGTTAPAPAEDRGSAEVSGDDRVRAGDSASGVPRGRTSRPAPPRVPGVKTARELYSEQMMERQAKLNKQRGL